MARLPPQGHGPPTVTWPEAVDEALCVGWIDGVRYRLAGWTREGKDGKKFLSIAASLPEEQRQQPAQQKPAGGPRFDDDHIPF